VYNIRNYWVFGLCASSRAIAQAVSRWLPTVAARVRARIWSCGICGGQSGAEAGFLRVLRFALPIFIPPIAPQSPSSIIIWGLYNRPEVAAVPSGHSPTTLIKKCCASSNILRTTFRKLDLFPSSGEGVGDTPLGLLVRANLGHWILEYRTMDKVKKI
jgi:hypothetical protein